MLAVAGALVIVRLIGDVDGARDLDGRNQRNPDSESQPTVEFRGELLGEGKFAI